MIDDDTLIGFALNALEPTEQAAVRERLKDDTAAQANLAKIRAILKPLEADREPPAPPTDLTAATLAKLDYQTVRPRRSGSAVGRWVELALAASIGLLGFGIVAGAITKVQNDNRKLACANNLRTVYTGLSNYADTHNGQYPQAGQPGAPNAGCFKTVLTESGHWPAEAAISCSNATSEPVGYTYSLGHKNVAGTLVGLNRASPVQPIVGDFPHRLAKVEGAVSPHGNGHNVLFTDGRVQFLTGPTWGTDNIFLNDAGLPRAGLHPRDCVLGHPADVP